MQEKEKENYVILFFICIIAIYHYSVVNDIEKIFFSSVLPREITKRPLKKCLYRQRKRQCQGFPSGHTEAATLGLLLLAKNDFLPLTVAFLGILMVGLQRILTRHHTLLQVLAGAGLGIIYYFVYSLTVKHLYKWLLIMTMISLFWMLFYEISAKIGIPTA